MTKGWHTSEFWLSLAAILIGILLSLLPSGSTWAHVAEFAASALVAAGYTVNRTTLKKAQATDPSGAVVPKP